VDDGIRELFGEGRNYPSLATTMEDGAPHAVSIWTGVEDDRIVFFTSPGSLKARNIARDPRVAFSLVDRANPYRTAQVRGEVVQTLDGDAAQVIIDRISQRYVGTPFPMTGSRIFFVESRWEKVTELPFAEPPAPGAPA
jgi:PPOX class probable F420-dependent enzyme